MTLLYGSRVDGRAWRYLFVLLMGTLPKYLDLATETGISKLSAIVAAFAGDEELTIHTVAHLFRAGIPALFEGPVRLRDVGICLALLLIMVARTG
jgi:hypothetical protein